MPASLSTLILSALPAIALLVLPGLALLRICLPKRELGFLSQLTIAPGITVALSVLLFTWSKIFGLQLGPLIPWLMIVAGFLGLLIERKHGRWCLAIRISRRRFRRTPMSAWFAGVALVAALAVLLVVRLNSTRGWVVPPGMDSPHHTTIVQLLLEHHGLFNSWAPYSDAETFTYHFGFHAVTALFAWITGSDAVFATFIMARVVAVCAMAALFAVVRLWTRNSWGGVFAVVFWALYSRQLSYFDWGGRWALLAGLTVLASALILLSLFLRGEGASKKWRLGLLCATTAAGLVLTHYKTAIIFAVLATALFGSRFVAAMFAPRPYRRGRILEISCRAFAIVVIASLLVAPRLSAVMETKTGQHLNRTLFEARPPDSTAVGVLSANTRELLLSRFANLQLAIALAILGGLGMLLRRREALWFVIGWAAVFVVMNPRLVGIHRSGLVDEIYWTYVIPSVFAALAGTAVGLACEAVGKLRYPAWNAVLLVGAVLLSGWSALRLPPVPESCRLVLPEDLPVMDWIKAHVPENEKIAGRGVFYAWMVMDYDALMWVPYFTRHLTNHTFAGGMEKVSVARRDQARSFTTELYQRDMSTAESANWMREQGYRWFYSGANAPAVQAVTPLEQVERDRQLLEQLAHNPALELVLAAGAARLYRVR